MKNVSITVGSVAVSGLPSGARSGEAIGRGIERALGRTLESGGLPRNPSPREVPSLRLPDLSLPAHATDAQIAEAVAVALRRMLAGGR